MSSRQTSEECTRLLDLPDSLLVCLVQALSLKDPTSYRHGLICRKFTEISPSAQAAVELAAWREEEPLLSAETVFANLSRLSIRDNSFLEDVHDFHAAHFAANVSWCRLQVLKTGTNLVPESFGATKIFQALSSEALTLLFQGCTELRSLTLEVASVNIPPSVTCLRRLEKLVVKGGVRVPDNIGNLQNLRSLELDFNEAALPTSLCHLSALEELELNAHYLLRLPEEIGRLRRLKSLRIVDAGKLTSLPNSVAALTMLRELTLYGCRSLMSLPAHLQMSMLCKLDVRSCKLLRNLPSSFSPSWRLRELGTSDFTDLEQLPRLRLLNIECYTEDLPETVGSLQELRALRVVMVTNDELPASVGNLRCLKSLHLVALPYLQSLPPELENLKHLSKLEIVHSPSLSQVRPITGLVSLEILKISDCQCLEEVPADLLDFCPALQELMLEKVPLTILPRGLDNRDRLKRVSLFCAKRDEMMIQWQRECRDANDDAFWSVT